MEGASACHQLSCNCWNDDGAGAAFTMPSPPLPAALAASAAATTSGATLNGHEGCAGRSIEGAAAAAGAVTALIGPCVCWLWRGVEAAECRWEASEHGDGGTVLPVAAVLPSGDAREPAAMLLAVRDSGELPLGAATVAMSALDVNDEEDEQRLPLAGPRRGVRSSVMMLARSRVTVAAVERGDDDAVDTVDVGDCCALPLRCSICC